MLLGGVALKSLQTSSPPLTTAMAVTCPLCRVLALPALPRTPPPPVDDWSLNCSHLPATVRAVHDALDFWCSYGSHLPVTLATVDTGQLCAVCGCPTKRFCLACQISLCSNQRKHKLTLYIRGQPNTVYISCSQWYHRFTLLPAIEHAGQQRMIASLRYELTHYPQSIKVDDQKKVVQHRCALCGTKAAHACLDCCATLCTVVRDFLLEAPGTQVVVSRSCNEVWHTEQPGDARARYCKSSRNAAENWLRSQRSNVDNSATGLSSLHF